MNATATRGASLSLNFDFSTQKSLVRSLEAYAKEIEAGLARSNLTEKQLADQANVCANTIYMHKNYGVRNPTVRAMFSILFALGWEEVTVRNQANVVETARRSSGVA